MVMIKTLKKEETNLLDNMAQTKEEVLSVLNMQCN